MMRWSLHKALAEGALALGRRDDAMRALSKALGALPVALVAVDEGQTFGKPVQVVVNTRERETNISVYGNVTLKNTDLRAETNFSPIYPSVFTLATRGHLVIEDSVVQSSLNEPGAMSEMVTRVKPSRILVAPPNCGSIERACPDEYTSTVREIVASGLEARGYSTIPRDQLVLTPRQRTEQHERTKVEKENDEHIALQELAHPALVLAYDERDSQRVERSSSTRIELLGSTFEDLPPAEQRKLRAEVNADGVTTIRIILGAKSGWDRSQNIDVVVRLGVGDDDRMVWVTRCTASSSDRGSAQHAVEQATRCAMSAVR